MELSVLRGKRIVIVIICALLGVSLFSIIFNTVTIGPDKIVTNIIRFLLTCFLCYKIYSGRNWAKWVIAILMLIAALMAFFGIFAIVKLPLLGVISLIIFLVYGSTSILLIFSKSIKDFMESQK